MPQSTADSRLSFLKNSAHFLSAQSPSTSAHLLTVHNQVLIEESKALSPSQQREFCAACGTIRVPGRTTNVYTKTRRAKKRRSDSPRPTRSTEPYSGVVYDCLRCSRQTIQPLQKPPRRGQGMKTLFTPSSSPRPSTTQSKQNFVEVDQPNHTAKARSESASSKKRAKTRKNQGLHALLAAGKQRSQSQNLQSTSLDLFDFLGPDARSRGK
jgi:hypothetical protein